MPRIQALGPLFAALVISGVAVLPPHPVEGPPVEQLAWLAGCLELRSGQRVVEEQRMGVRGGSMLGMSRTTASGRLAEYELTLIHERAPQVTCG